MSLPRFQPSLDIKTLIDMLLSSEIGETITYEKMDAAIGRNIRASRSMLSSALKNVQNSHHFVFSCVPMVGYKRLNNSEIVGKGEQFIKHIKRTSRRGAKNMACVEYDALSKDEKTAHNTRMTIFAMVQDNVSTKTTKRIEKMVSDSNSALPSARAAMELLSQVK